MRNLWLLLLLPFATRAQERVVSLSDPFSRYHSGHYSMIPLPEQDAFVLTYPGQYGIQRVLKQNGYPAIPILQQVSDTAYKATGYRSTKTVDPGLIRLYHNYRNLGGVYHNKILLEAIQQRRQKSIYLVRTDLQSGESQITDTIPYEDPDDLLSCVAYGPVLKLLLTHRGSSGFEIYTADMSGVLRKRALDVPFQLNQSAAVGLRTGRVDVVSDLFYPRRFRVFDDRLPYPALSATGRMKQFEQKERVVFLVATTDCRTEALILDLATDTLVHRSFAQSGQKLHSKVTNAFLVDTILVTARADGESLNLEYFHLLSGLRLGEQVIDQQTFASQSNSSMEKRGNFWTNTDIKPSTVRQFLDYASTNQLAIAAWRKGANLIVDLAAPYEDPINATLLANVLVSAAGTYAINASPNTRGYLLTAFPSAQASTYIGFQTAVRDQDFLFAPLQPDRSFWERNYGQLRPEQQLLGFMNGYFYVGQPNKEASGILISRFNAHSPSDR